MRHIASLPPKLREDVERRRSEDAQLLPEQEGSVVIEILGHHRRRIRAVSDQEQKLAK